MRFLAGVDARPDALGAFRSAGAGPGAAVLIMLLLVAVLAIDPREALMPFVVNSFKLVEMRRASIRRTAKWAVAALLIALAVAIPVTLTFQYNDGVDRSDAWAVESSPAEPFADTMQVQQRLTAQGNLKAAEATTGWRRFSRCRRSPHG